MQNEKLKNNPTNNLQIKNNNIVKTRFCKKLINLKTKNSLLINNATAPLVSKANVYLEVFVLFLETSHKVKINTNNKVIDMAIKLSNSDFRPENL